MQGKNSLLAHYQVCRSSSLSIRPIMFFPEGSQYFFFCFLSGSLPNGFLLFGMGLHTFQAFFSAAARVCLPMVTEARTATSRVAAIMDRDRGAGT